MEGHWNTYSLKDTTDGPGHHYMSSREEVVSTRTLEDKLCKTRGI